VEQSTVVDDVGLLGERDAAVADRLVQILDGGKAAVGERLADEDPKMFGRLELRTVGWLVHEGNAVGHGQVFHGKSFMGCRSGEAWWKTNENARTLISIMARSKDRSKVRPDTLMQDHSPRIGETSCDARPDHACGSQNRKSRTASTAAWEGLQTPTAGRFKGRRSNAQFDAVR
jgi:hypothetical protein